MGIAGIILGILGIICSFIPGLVYGAWVLALIGIIKSANGMTEAKTENKPIGTAVAGLVLSIFSLLHAIFYFFFAIDSPRAHSQILRTLIEGGY